MNILIIRHGEPDYANDSITERGADDARRLAAIVDRYHIDEFYVSPLGRARATIQPSLDRLGVQAEVLPWLREFSVPIRRPDKPDSPIPWDWMPADWTAQEDFFDEVKWSSVPVMRDAGVPACWATCCTCRSCPSGMGPAPSPPRSQRLRRRSVRTELPASACSISAPCPICGKPESNLLSRPAMWNASAMKAVTDCRL